MKRVLFVALLCVTWSAFAQLDNDQEKAFRERAAKVGQDTSKHYGWTHALVTGLNLTQVSFKDWVQGGDNALSYSLWGKGSSVQAMEKTDWFNNYKLTFGQTRLASQGLRKTDDEIFFESLLIYKLGVYINPYAAVTFRTQFAKGYQYSGDQEIAVSKFFDPAYLTQSVGVAYKPMPEVTTRLGVGVREVLASEFAALYTDDPATTQKLEKSDIQGGMESVTDVKWGFAENMLFSSTLELFAPFNKLDRIIVRNDNTISAMVNKYVTVNFNVTLINDARVSPRTQMKQTLALGVIYTLL
jgi:hypothetical protein